MSILKNFFSVVEMRTKVVSITTLSSALVYVWWRFGFPSLYPLIIMWVASLAVDMGTTAFNNYFDYLKGTDVNRDESEPDKLLALGKVEPSFVFWSAFICYIVAIVLGLIIGLSINLWLIPVGFVCMCAGFLYTGGPIPISRTPFGELFAGGFLGCILFLIATKVWGGIVDSKSLLAALPCACVIASILMVNNTCDIAGDILAGRKTLAIILGSAWGEFFVVLYGLLGIGITVFASFAGALPRFHAISMPLSLIGILPLWIKMHRSGYSHATKGQNMQAILQVLLVFTFAFVLGFAFL